MISSVSSARALFFDTGGVLMEMKKSRTGCLLAFVIVQSIAIGVLIIAVLGISMISRSFSLGSSRSDFGADERPEMTEVWSCGSGETKVIRIPLVGVITLSKGGGLFSSESGSALQALRSIKRATHDPDVEAIIMEIDSPGGGITASDIIHKALLDFKKAKEGRKVVSLFGDVAASGGYYVAVASDLIISRPTAITGSIGVIMQSFNIKELGAKLGIKDVTIKSGDNKDILNPFKDLTIEQREILQSIVDEMYDHFVTIVAQGRNMPREDVIAAADGQIFTADKAISLGLVDQIGYWDDAVAKTAELLAEDSIRVYRYEEEFSLLSFLKARQRILPDASLLQEAARMRLMYLWRL